MSASPRAVVLMYHRLDPQAARPEEGDYVLPRPLFERQIAWLVASARPVVPLARLVAGEFEDGAVVLTFDDGCDTDASVALPRLLETGFPATFFVNPATLGQRGRLGWPEVDRLATAGMRIGSHGLDHTLLDGLAPGEIERQLEVSRRLLEQRLQMEVDALSLPGGSGGRAAVEIARQLGYRIVLGSRPGRVRRGRIHLPLPRYAVRRGHGFHGFRAIVQQRLGFRILQAGRHRMLGLVRIALGTHTYARWAESRSLRRVRGGHR